MKPVAKKSGIFAEYLPEEVVLYDKTHDKVHCLDKTAAAVWENSDGSKTVDDLTLVVEAKCGGPADRKLVLQALEELEDAGLLVAGSGMVSDARLPSRREAVGKMVMAGSALVATIVAAAPAAHASALAPMYPPKLPISHNPPDPPPSPPKGHNPPDPPPPSPPKRHNPPNPQLPLPFTALDPTNPQPPHPLIGLNLANPKPPDPPTGVIRLAQKPEFLNYFIRPVRLVLTHSLRVARTFWGTSG